MKVILASASPRRRELLQQIGIEAVVCPAVYNEAGGTAVEAEQVVLSNALGKCRAVAAEKGSSIPVVAADTIVVTDNKILGKPACEAEAAAMLRLLSGREHKVMTGLAVIYQGRELSEVCVTRVLFRSLSDREISAYVATGEPLDKAGAYGIQGKGAVLVEKIDGCYNNVVGLPLTRLYMLLSAIGAEGVAPECKKDK